MNIDTKIVRIDYQEHKNITSISRDQEISRKPTEVLIKGQDINCRIYVENELLFICNR